MQITKNELKNLIKEELQRFSLQEEGEELSSEAREALEAIAKVTDQEELDRIYAMAKAGQSLET